MSKPVLIPRINNNDDSVRLVRLLVSVGDHVQRDQILAEVETDKSVSEVRAESEGVVLKLFGVEGAQLNVGGILAWLGDHPDETIPETAEEHGRESPRHANQPTAKALLLISQHGLDPTVVPSDGPRLSAGDVEKYLAARRPHERLAESERPLAEGKFSALSTTRRAMLKSVAWHRDEAVPAYLEVPYDPSVWEEYAADYSQSHQLLLSPLLSLIACRLVELAHSTPNVNSTIISGDLYNYEEVHLGFTVQSRETLYLAVLRSASRLDPRMFTSRLGELQRRALAGKLRPEESQGATVSFSSMARWKATRHIPILPPFTSLIVAHAAAERGFGVLGATYDHRILTGGEVAQLLQHLSIPKSS